VVPSLSNAIELDGSTEAKARYFLNTLLNDPSFPKNLDDFTIEAIVETPAGYHVRFVQKKNGFEVKGGGITVTLGRDNRVLAIQNSYHALSMEQKPFYFTLTENEAIVQAFQDLKLTSTPANQIVEKKVKEENGELRPVYEIKFTSARDKKWSWEAVVDGEDGTVYSSKSLAHTERQDHSPNAWVSARVFDPNPTILSDQAYGSVPGFENDNDGNSDFFDRMMFQTKIDTTYINGKYRLENQYVKITDQELPQNPDCTSPFGSFNFRRGDPCFTDVNAFYHVSQSLTYLNETLGFHAHPIKYTGGVHVDPHGLEGDDNSHYLPDEDELAYGDGGVPDAQDHDVVLHELGHAIHNWLTHGHMSQVEGLSEGSADYWASSYSRSQMRPDNIAYNWVFSFDGHNEFWKGRIVNSPLRYPDAVKGKYSEIHTAGQMWSTTCIAIWDQIGKFRMDKIFWSGIAMLDENSSQLDAAKAIYAAAKQIYPRDHKLQNTVKDTFNEYGYQF
jgi:Zn-dependent metalloprotease